MLFRVFHNNVPNFMDPEPAEMDLLRQMFPYGFMEVATVETQDVGAVFQLTNHIDRNWTENPEVKSFATDHVRSTSVGDVIVDASGDRYLVKSIGLEKF